MDDLIHKFSNRQYDKSELCNEIASVAYNYRRYGFHVDEFYFYNVKKMSHMGKMEYITEESRWEYYDIFNNPDNLKIFDDKWMTYQRFKKFYDREILLIDGANDKEKFTRFCSKNRGKLVLKPREGSGGKGVRLLDEKTDSFESLLADYGDGFIVEELMNNHRDLALINESSLNAVRITTVKLPNTTKIAFCTLKFGVGDSFVCNSAAGGITCAVDIKSGVVFSAVDKKGNTYIVNPNSKQKIIGMKLPKWRELVHMAKDLAEIIPDNRYTGWDFAYTDKKRWTLIEANARGQFTSQLPYGEGFRHQFDRYAKILKSDKVGHTWKKRLKFLSLRENY